MIFSGCAGHRSVYVYISVKGSRVCKPCNVLAVRKCVRASMVQGYNLINIGFLFLLVLYDCILCSF